MSIFGPLMGDMEDDPFFGCHMRHMRQMSNMMNSLFSDPFSMLRPPMLGYDDFENRALTSRHNMHNSLMSPFSMPIMPNFNRLLSGSLDSMANTGNYHSSSTVISMTSGPDGRQQLYKATSSTRVAPGGVKETQKTVTDSMTGTKKMSIGHHIGERAHIIEKEQNMHTGERVESEDLINIEDDEKEEFNNEWESKTRRSEIPRITAGSSRNRHGSYLHSSIPAITAGSSSRRHRDRTVPATSPSVISARRGIRSPKLALPSTSAPSAAGRHPYSSPNQPQQPKKSKSLKTFEEDPSPPQADN
ncbi:myeloid leukemia factor isoform X1 [Diabrotica undecimpunctata]|uniref:myeloid leukemia factor isoform X1 n=1 Tax=Diabrotica undecimpunctata TaxID=50387 RepID=UPI003B63316B